MFATFLGLCVSLLGNAFFFDFDNRKSMLLALGQFTSPFFDSASQDNLQIFAQPLLLSLPFGRTFCDFLFPLFL